MLAEDVEVVLEVLVAEKNQLSFIISTTLLPSSLPASSSPISKTDTIACSQCFSIVKKNEVFLLFMATALVQDVEVVATIDLSQSVISRASARFNETGYYNRRLCQGRQRITTERNTRTPLVIARGSLIAE
ncbi:hypothetical protein PV328_011732, partial [Microctonus aethiopoides]